MFFDDNNFEYFAIRGINLFFADVEYSGPLPPPILYYVVATDDNDYITTDDNTLLLI